MPLGRLVLGVDVVVGRIVQSLQSRNAIPLSTGSVGTLRQALGIGRGRKGGRGKVGRSRQISQHVRPPHKSSVCNREGDTVSVGFFEKKSILPKFFICLEKVFFFVDKSLSQGNVKNEIASIWQITVDQNMLGRVGSRGGVNRGLYGGTFDVLWLPCCC